MYSTYLGGNDYDYGYGIAIDGSGNAHVTGSTESTDYDVAAGAYQTTKCGSYDVFITKLSLPATGFEGLSYTASWNLFPNPTNGSFTLQTQQGGVFELMDLCGKVIQTYKLQNAIEQIQVNLPSGIYFIREKETGCTQKLVIE